MPTPSRLPPRRADWRPRLAAFLAQADARPLEWGRFDCAVGLAAGAVEAVTGADPAADLRGQWDDMLSARRWVWNRHSTVRAAVESVLGAAVEPRRARDGDVVLVVDPAGAWCLGVLLNARALVMSQGGGLARLDPARIRWAWTL